jgi:hypothetical protein
MLPLAPTLGKDDPKPKEEARPVVVVDSPKVKFFTKVDTKDGPVEEITQDVVFEVLGDITLDDAAVVADQVKKDDPAKDAPATKTQRRIVIQRDERPESKVRELRTVRARAAQDTKATPEDRAELEKASAELKAAQLALSKAAKRFAEAQTKVATAGIKGLEFDIVVSDPTKPDGQMRIHRVIPPGTEPATAAKIHAEIRAKVDGAKAEAEAAARKTERTERREILIRRPERPEAPEAPAGPRAPAAPRARPTPAAAPAPAGDEDARLKALEKKLEALAGELKALKSKKD